MLLNILLMYNLTLLVACDNPNSRRGENNLLSDGPGAIGEPPTGQEPTKGVPPPDQPQSQEPPSGQTANGGAPMDGVTPNEMPNGQPPTGEAPMDGVAPNEIPSGQPPSGDATRGNPRDQNDGPVEGAIGEEVTKATTRFGDCDKGKCWGEEARFHVLDPTTNCYLYSDIAVLVTSQMTNGDITIWKRDSAKQCPQAKETDHFLQRKGAWQGRVGEHLILYAEQGSDNIDVMIYSAKTKKKVLQLPVGTNTPTITSESVMKTTVLVGDLGCVPNQSDYATCSQQAWSTLQNKNTFLKGKSLPQCTHDNGSGIPASQLAWTIAMDVQVDLKKTKSNVSYIGNPKCIPIL